VKTRPRARSTRDQHGIPQIVADDIEGLYWGMGYCHAMDRGLQMLIMRILGQGRAAELLDGSDEMVEVDRFFRRMNWNSGVEEEAAKLSVEARTACEAYCEGVNSRFAKSTPWELRLVPSVPPDSIVPASRKFSSASGSYPNRSNGPAPQPA
jgi:penicillin amidase